MADLLTDSYLTTSWDHPNPWIYYDFKGRRVAPTSYSIRTDSLWSPRSWAFEVSNDGSEGSWEVIDRRDGIEVTLLPTAHSHCFENIYGDNPNERRQRVTATADPFSVEGLKDVQARRPCWLLPVVTSEMALTP